MQIYFWRKFSDFHVTDGSDLAQLQPRFPQRYVAPHIVITMGMLLRPSVFLWISVGFLSLPRTSEACGGTDFPEGCKFVIRNACFEFVAGSETWSQARSSCEKRGGELLKVMNTEIKLFLKNITRGRNTNHFSWWLADGVQGQYQVPIKNAELSKGKCTYVKLGPLQIIQTSDCNQRRGFLCSHSVCESSSNTNNTSGSTRATRSVISEIIKHLSSKVTNTVVGLFFSQSIEELLQEADKELYRMETTVGEPTANSMESFIDYMYAVTINLVSNISLHSGLKNKDIIISHIKTCTTGILLLSQENCHPDNDPNPTTLKLKAFEIVQKISLLVDVGDQGTFIIRDPSGTLYQSRYRAADLGNSMLGSVEDGQFAKLPSGEALERQLKNHTTVTAQLTSLTENPHSSDGNISGTVCSIKLSDASSNEEIKLANLTQMIEIFMNNPQASMPTNNTVLLEYNTKAVTTVNVSNTESTLFVSVEPNANVSLQLVLAAGSPPNKTHFSHTTTLSPTGNYRWRITPEMLSGTSGAWYVSASLVNSTWEPGLTLTISSFTGRCLYWDTENETWSSDGCQVGDKSTPQRIHCLCNHLTLFGGSFFVMPNYVDISRTSELFATASENYVVLALLCAFFGLYLITLLWACYSDRRARSKRKMTLLEDNHPGAQYNYLIGVQTGHRKNAGTTANVTVKVIGSEGDSGTHNLTDPEKPVFQRGAFDIFLLATPFPLGEVRNLRLQHDDSGGHPSWYVNKVTIQDLQTQQVFHFFCECWLSSDHGDSMTKKTFNAAKSNEITSFRNIFHSRTSNGFRDEHIWVSIVDPPSRSPFTRAQRVSCCMSLLLCTMAINIAFWNIPKDENSPVLFSFGSMQITWQELMVGIQSGLLMFPINILIITIFRSIRPRVTSKAKKENSVENLTLPPVTMATILKDTNEVISSVSSSPRNKMSDMHRLESTTDLCLALDRVHEFIQLMQGESESDLHWVYCSKFLLAALCHLLMCLEKLDERQFLSAHEYQQTLNHTNLLVHKAEMVLSSHLVSCPPPVMKTKKRSASCWLPWWCVILGWFLLLSISGISTYFTLLYGFTYGKVKSTKWVISLGLSLFQSIFVLQPLKVIGLAVFFALMLKPVAVEETEEVEQVMTEQQERCRRYTGRHAL
uniref:polycystic kidney disease protein 1-like 2 n=1 Tax=Gasterosteus aculeatus aculeatus TaxID=481459 RepID=UPI001A98D708|nr:polycystic kidney disease protein 1-like 2 [Gasterosteus aculeatus aculeatus]